MEVWTAIYLNLKKNNGLNYKAVEKWTDTLSNVAKCSLRETLWKWCYHLEKRWSLTNRTLEPFLNKNHDWLNMELILPEEYIHELPSSCSAGNPPVRSKSFEQLPERQKRRTKYFRNCSEEIFSFVVKKRIKSEKARYVIEFMQNHPEHIDENLISQNPNSRRSLCHCQINPFSV